MCTESMCKDMHCNTACKNNVTVFHTAHGYISKLRLDTCKDNLTPLLDSGKIKKLKKKKKLRLGKNSVIPIFKQCIDEFWMDKYVVKLHNYILGNAYQIQNCGCLWGEMGVMKRMAWRLSCICSIVFLERSVWRRGRE